MKQSTPRRPKPIDFGQSGTPEFRRQLAARLAMTSPKATLWPKGHPLTTNGPIGIMRLLAFEYLGEDVTCDLCGLRLDWHAKDGIRRVNVAARVDQPLALQDWMICCAQHSIVTYVARVLGEPLDHTKWPGSTTHLDALTMSGEDGVRIHSGSNPFRGGVSPASVSGAGSRETYPSDDRLRETAQLVARGTRDGDLARFLGHLIAARIELGLDPVCAELDADLLTSKD